ncbi:mitochondrial genome maintenance exonuclease 1, partial [Thermus arciformis]
FVLALREGLSLQEVPLEEAAQAFLGLLAVHRFLKVLEATP